MDNKTIKIKVGLIALPFITSIIVWVFGRYQLSPREVIYIIADWIFQNPDIDRQGYLVVVSIRLSRILMSLLVGMGLSVSGVAFQSLFSNPLTTPDILGVSSGAAFGAAIGILLGFNAQFIQMSAVFFGIFAVLITIFISRKTGNNTSVMLILSGIVVTSVFNALLSGVKFIADPYSKLPSITFWLMGSMNAASFKTIFLYAPNIIIGVLILYLLRWKLNILSLSDEEAITLGLKIKYIRALIIFSATLITASCVALCGIIGWVGLLVPHICRMIFGYDNKIVIPASISFGATFLVVIDTFARTLITSELPLGILCSLMGAPIFIILLRRTRGEI